MATGPIIIAVRFSLDVHNKEVESDTGNNTKNRGHIRYGVGEADLRERGVWEAKESRAPTVADAVGWMIAAMVLFVGYIVGSRVWDMVERVQVRQEPVNTEKPARQVTTVPSEPRLDRTRSRLSAPDPLKRQASVARARDKLERVNGWLSSAEESVAGYLGRFITPHRNSRSLRHPDDPPPGSASPAE